jgi:hypothetical protein
LAIFWQNKANGHILQHVADRPGAVWQNKANRQ